mmetsp:Transcript_31287/g.75678  ORF Transcript_31287/g.75678 Transcript_31287/m.75678 type:complete len:100 (+) Transcript_31287:721-1020(+)
MNQADTRTTQSLLLNKHSPISVRVPRFEMNNERTYHQINYEGITETKKTRKESRPSLSSQGFVQSTNIKTKEIFKYMKTKSSDKERVNQNVSNLTNTEN